MLPGSFLNNAGDGFIDFEYSCGVHSSLNAAIMKENGNKDILKFKYIFHLRCGNNTICKENFN